MTLRLRKRKAKARPLQSGKTRSVCTRLPRVLSLSGSGSQRQGGERLERRGLEILGSTRLGRCKFQVSWKPRLADGTGLVPGLAVPTFRPGSSMGSHVRDACQAFAS